MLAPFLDSHPARFEVPGSPEEGRRLLAEGLGTAWLPFTRRELVGFIIFGRVFVRRKRAWLHNSFAPVFRGEFESNQGRTLLVGQFTMRWSVRLFMLLWFWGVGLFLVVAITGLAVSRDPVFMKLLFLVAPIVMVIVGLALVHYFWNQGRPDIEFLTKGIRNVFQQHGT